MARLLQVQWVEGVVELLFVAVEEACEGDELAWIKCLNWIWLIAGKV